MGLGIPGFGDRRVWGFGGSKGLGFKVFCGSGFEDSELHCRGRLEPQIP